VSKAAEPGRPPAGWVRLTVRRVGGRTRLTQLTCRPPLQVMRAHYLDRRLEEMAFVTVLSPSGGVLQGDCLSIEVDAGERTWLHLDTASATRIYRMPRLGARQRVAITVGEGAFVEVVPEPYLPYAGARFEQEGRFEVAESGTLLLAEVVAPGRQARGEELAYERFSSLAEVWRPGGQLLFRDWCRLDPRDRLRACGRLGGFGAVGSLYVVSQDCASDLLAGALSGLSPDLAWAGASELPNRAGAWMRVLARDSATAVAAVESAWRAARTAIVGAPPPPRRRY